MCVRATLFMMRDTLRCIAGFPLPVVSPPSSLRKHWNTLLHILVPAEELLPSCVAWMWQGHEAHLGGPHCNAVSRAGAVLPDERQLSKEFSRSHAANHLLLPLHLHTHEWMPLQEICNLQVPSNLKDRPGICLIHGLQGIP